MLAYLKSLGFIYTTEAVWRNMQREILKRPLNMISKGRPKEAASTMGRRRAVDVIQLAEEAVTVARMGTDPKEFLAGKGYKNPTSAWASMKEIYLEEHPGETLPDVPRKPREKKPKIQTFSKDAPDKHKAECLEKAPEAAADSPAKTDAGTASEAPAAAKEAGKLPPKGAQGGYADPKELAKEIARKMGEKSGAVVTCCAPARPSGVSVPDEIPDKAPETKLKSMKISAVESDYAKYEISGERNEMLRITAYRHGALEPAGIEFGPEAWLQIAKEIPRALKLLGLTR